MTDEKLHERYSVKHCPKCGVEFTAKNPRMVRYWDGVEYQPSRNIFKLLLTDCLVETGEYLRVICSVCDYGWKERCVTEGAVK